MGPGRPPENKIRLPNNWKPRASQMDLWKYLENGGKRAVEVAHRRFGKDDIALHFAATQTQQRIGNYWHMLPEYGQARKSVWDAVNPRTGIRRIDEAFPFQIREDARNSDMFIRFLNGSTWQLVGSDNFDSLVGSPPIGIVFSEFALANPRAWSYISPILEENGGWAVFISTPRGNNHLKSLYDYACTADGWYAGLDPATITGVFTANQLKRILDEYIAIWKDETLGTMLFNQEYLCDFEGVTPGAYFAKQMKTAREEGRITEVPWVPNIEVYTYWDLGVDDSMTIWFVQVVGSQFRIIDYYENSGLNLVHYARILKDKPYAYGEHIMPHDAAVREMTSGGGEVARSRKEVALGLGIKPIHTVERPRDINAVLFGIELTRNLISQCWFDRKKCRDGISALEAYAAEYDEEKKKLSNRPVHNWTSHAADAFRTLAVGYKNRVKKPVKTVTEMMGEVRMSALF
jgi:phage terminase large subunit